MLPNSATQNGSTSSHQIPSSRNLVSSEVRSTLGEVNVMDRSDTNQMVFDGVEDELQPQEAEEEQVLLVTSRIYTVLSVLHRYSGKKSVRIII
jgi:hypothetical protein